MSSERRSGNAAPGGGRDGDEGEGVADVSAGIAFGRGAGRAAGRGAEHGAGRRAEQERWRPRQLREGRDPDPRFTLANERTLLAWLRTSMALIAGAVALEAFAADTIPAGIRTPLAVVLLVCASALAIYAFRRWLRMEAAMRHGRPLPAPGGAVIIAAGVAAAALALVVGIAWNI